MSMIDLLGELYQCAYTARPKFGPTSASRGSHGIGTISTQQLDGRYTPLFLVHSSTTGILSD
jgi:hypothetical protein